MNKLTTILAALAMSSAAFAQTSVQDSIAAAKAQAKALAAAEKSQAKALKAAKAAELKAFKEKQKAELAAFVKAQNSEKTGEYTVEVPALTTADDSVAYIFGIMQSNGLMQYMKGQLGVDMAQIENFAQGVFDRTSVSPDNKEKAAFNAGNQVGGMVMSMVNQFSGEYYAAESGKKADAGIVSHGLIAGLLGQGFITPDSAATYFSNIMTARKAANNEALYGANRDAGEKFLAENAKKEGVVVLPSGLQYKILSQGNTAAAKPTATSKVKVNYEGTLIDGTVFDSSIKRGTPASFQVNQVIKGWTEALQLMSPGAKWELYIPYQLAYGDRESGQIKPYSALVFSVELIEVE